MKVSFDSATMRLNASGRAVWENPPPGVRRGSFVKGGVYFEPSSGRVELGATDRPLEVSEAPPARPDARLLDGLGGVPLPEVHGPEVVEVAGEVTGPAVEVSQAEPLELPEDVSPPALVLEDAGDEPPPIAEDGTEARGLAMLHETLVNRFAAAHPRPYTAQERSDVAAACACMLNRYGGALRGHSPLVSFAMVSATVVIERQVIACASCGGALLPRALFCGECGASCGTGGGACVEACGVQGMPAGVKFCVGCGASQVKRGGARLPDAGAAS